VSEANGASAGHRCGDCRHWHKLPADPRNLARPPEGHCREGPPVPLLVGPGQYAWVWPQLPPQYPACGRFALALPVVESK
jgi:hypothetical protein